MIIKLDGNMLTLELVCEAVRGEKVELCPEAVKRVNKSRRQVEDIVSCEKVAYGINTGFGTLSEVSIDKDKVEELQRNLIHSHSIGVGEPFDRITTRAIMVLRANTLAKGHSGIRLSTLQHLLDMLNAGIHPVIPEKGSVGASGDLAPLSHLALGMTGEGPVEYKGRIMSGHAAFRKAGMNAVTLVAKEGLALINGTQVMTAVAILALLEAEDAARVADIIGAITCEAMLGSVKPFQDCIHKLRPHPGQRASASNLRKLLKNSPIVKSHRNCNRVQDAYSLRCMPQVHGASRDAFAYLRRVLEIETNSATDNPLLFPDDGTVISGGNFHGQPVAIACDLGAIAAAELGNISERRVEQLVNPHLSSGLPPFLIKEEGLNCGFMIAQVASASLVSENKSLAHPASVDSIPSSAGREDHVSMGTIAARKFRTIVHNLQEVLAIEMMVACQALDLRKPLQPAKATSAVLETVRKQVPFMAKDRSLYPDQRKILELIRNGNILKSAEMIAGKLA